MSGLQAEVASLRRVKEEMGHEMTGLTIRTEQAGSGNAPYFRGLPLNKVFLGKIP